MALLRVDHLTASFRLGRGWATVVDDVSFSVAPGETLAIVGESGSGKSVTALAIMRLLPPHVARVTGTAHLGETDLLALPEAAMEQVRGRDIAMIFQEPMTSLNPVLTIGRQIAETLIRHESLDRSQARARTIALLDRVRIPSARARFDEYPHQMSGGMIQRVMIAMALACRPQVLIADEPTTALDVTVQAEILGLLRTLQREDGMGLLFITHDMGVVAEMADRTLVMYRSRLIEAGATEAIFARPTEDYTRALLAAVPRLGAMAGRTAPTPVADEGAAASESAPDADMEPPVARDEAPVLDVRNLVARFDVRRGILGRVRRRVHAVEDVSFSIAPGETLSLVGESGCGKSTTGRCIVRLVDPVSGSIRIEGRDILALEGEALRRQRGRMQMIFQDPLASLNPRLRIADALIEPLVAHGMAGRDEARGIAEDLLRRVGLDVAMANRFPHEVSGGQRQRICIARALALQPGLLVADESVSALDVSVKAQVVSLLLELQAQFRIGMLFISHDMAVVERVSHRVAVMYLGEIVEMGPRADVFANPRHPYTRRLLDAVPVADPRRRQSQRAAPFRELESAVRPLDYVPPVRTYATVGPGHMVRVDDPALT